MILYFLKHKSIDGVKIGFTDNFDRVETGFALNSPTGVELSIIVEIKDRMVYNDLINELKPYNMRLDFYYIDYVAISKLIDKLTGL
jgi:hypothetical protein